MLSCQTGHSRVLAAHSHRFDLTRHFKPLAATHRCLCWPATRRCVGLHADPVATCTSSWPTELRFKAGRERVSNDGTLLIGLGEVYYLATGRAPTLVGHLKAGL